MTLAERLRTALAAGHSEYPVLLPGDHAELDLSLPRQPAAVLVAVTDGAEPGVILTQRTAMLRRHAGQIAFPGGRIDPEDAGPIEAALREAEEEIALPRASAEVVGVADRYRSVTGYEVTPVLAVVPRLASEVERRAWRRRQLLVNFGAVTLLIGSAAFALIMWKM